MLTLTVLKERLAVCRLDPKQALPAWALGPGFSSITRTPDELSVVCAEESVPPDVRAERGWGCLKIEGPLDFALTGILASVLAPLAAAEISIFALSTFDTDYILVKDADLEQATTVLEPDFRIVR